MLPALRPSTTPRARRALSVLLATSATIGLAACGAEQKAQTDDFTGAQGEVQDVVQKLADLAEKDDAAGICSKVLGPQLKQSLGGDAGCAAGVKDAIQNADYTSLNVVAVTVDTAGLMGVAQIKPVEDADARRSITVSRKTKSAPWLITALDPSGKTKLPATTPTGTTPESTTPAKTTPAPKS